MPRLAGSSADTRGSREHERHLAQRPHDQRWRRIRRRAQRHVVPFLDQIDEAVLQPQVDQHFRIALPVRDENIGELARREPAGRGHFQHALRMRRLRADRGFRRLQDVERLTALLVVHAAGFGEAQVARRPVEQAHAQLAFEIRDVLARHRGRDIEPFGGLHEASRLDDFAKHPQAGQRIHRSFPGRK